MKIYISLDADNFANGWASMPMGGSSVEIDISEGHSFFTNITAHKLVGAEFVFDTERSQQNAENEKIQMRSVDQKAETEMLKKRQSETENAVMMLMEIQMMGGM